MSVNQPPARSRAAPLLLWSAVLLGAALLGAAVTAALLGSPSAASRIASLAPQPRAEPLDVEWLRVALASVQVTERARLLDDAERFRAFVEEEVARRRLLEVARAEGLADDVRIAWLAGRAGEQVLVNAFLNARVAAAVGPEFPDEARVREFYAANEARYVLPERVAVSQIFLPTTKNASPDERQRTAAGASAIVAGIRDGSVSFELAAAEHSAHAPSAANGGFMGLVRVADLRPELREAVLSLEPGEVSEPLVGGEGVHIVRRGPTVPARVPPLESVRERVEADLERAAAAELRRKLAVNALETSAARPQPEEIERWREALLASGPPRPETTDPAPESSQISSQTPIK